MSWLPEPESEHGQRVRRRLAAEVVIWYTSVGRDGTPQPNPVWFLADEDGFLIYNRPRAARVHHARAGGRVALNFDTNGTGGDIVVFTGTAGIVDGAPPADDNAAYVDKYRARMERVSGSLAKFGRDYPVLIRVRPERTRGF